MKGTFNTERELRRAGDSFIGGQRLKLQKMLEAFIADATGKEEDEIRSLYEWYEREWNTFANSANKKASAKFTIYGDAFEAACRSGFATMEKIDASTAPFDVAEAKRIFKIFRKRSLLQRLFDNFRRKSQPKKSMSVVK